MSNFYCLIPARLKSSRFPNKMLKLIHDKPLIQYVYDKCLKSKIFKKVLVATCDKEIYNIIIDNNSAKIINHFQSDFTSSSDCKSSKSASTVL